MNSFELTHATIHIIENVHLIANVSLIDFTTVIAHSNTFTSPSYTFFDEESCVLTVRITPFYSLQSVLISSSQITQISRDFDIKEDKSVTLYL